MATNMFSVEINLVVVKLLSEIKKHECLWNSDLSVASTKQQRDNAWKTIASKLLPGFAEFDEEKEENAINHLKRKWKHMRDCFSREERSRKSSSSIHRKPYMYYNMMSFIKKKKFNEQSGVTIKEEIDESSNSSTEFREYTTDKQTTASISSGFAIKMQTASTSTESAQSQMSRSMTEHTTDNETPSAPTKNAENQVPNSITENSSILTEQKSTSGEELEHDRLIDALQKLTEDKTTTKQKSQELSGLLRELEAEKMKNQEPTASSGIHTVSFSKESEEHNIIKASNDCLKRISEVETSVNQNDFDCNIFSPVIMQISSVQTKQRKNHHKAQHFSAVNTQTSGFRTNKTSRSSTRFQTDKRTTISSKENHAFNNFSAAENEILHFPPEYMQKQTSKNTDLMLCTCCRPISECKKREVAMQGMFECKKLCLALEKSLAANSVQKQDSDELFFQSLMLEFKLIPKEEKAQAKCEMIKMIEAFKIDS